MKKICRTYRESLQNDSKLHSKVKIKDKRQASSGKQQAGKKRFDRCYRIIQDVFINRKVQYDKRNKRQINQSTNQNSGNIRRDPAAGEAGPGEDGKGKTKRA